MEVFETTLALITAALVLTAFAGRFNIPYPSFLVVGGVVLGFLPVAEKAPALAPDLVFALFLPPILFEAAYNTSWRDFRSNARPISSLAVGLVVASTAAVALVANWLIPEMPLGAAIVLGAIVAPPDAAAATAVLRRTRLPDRIVTLVEGESLVNDAVALVIYRFAVAAVVTGSFSSAQASRVLVVNVIGSVALGYALGRVWSRIARRIPDAQLTVVASFLVAFAAYRFAERLGVSGVLAVVTCGLVFGRRSAVALTPDARLSGGAVWRIVIFVLNALAFVLIGLQLPQILTDLEDYSSARLAWMAGAIAGVAIFVRLLWVTVFWGIGRRFLGRHAFPGSREALVIGWAGMRGIVSLAAALALPGTTDAGVPFPSRDLVLCLAFAVIVATLVLQGLTLGGLIRLLGIRDDDSIGAEEREARVAAATAALAVLDRLAETPGLPQEVFARLRLLYADRIQRYSVTISTTDGEMTANADFVDSVRLSALSAERETVLTLRRQGVIGDGALHRIERDLDLIELTVKRSRPEYARATWLDRRPKQGRAGLRSVLKRA